MIDVPGQLPLPDLDPTTHARSGDPDTSHAAAVALSSKRTMMRRLLIEYRLVGAMTTDEAITAAGFRPVDGAWKRVSDLAMLGLIADTGDRREGSSGRLQIVRAITEKGRQALNATSDTGGGGGLPGPPSGIPSASPAQDSETSGLQPTARGRGGSSAGRFGSNRGSWVWKPG